MKGLVLTLFAVLTLGGSLPAAPGKYTGETGQTGKTIEFEVSADGLHLANLVMWFKADCTPPFVYESRMWQDEKLELAIRADRTFDTYAAGGGAAHGAYELHGRFDSVDGTTVSGTLQIHVKYDEGGVHYECDTGTVTWSARRVGPLPDRTSPTVQALAATGAHGKPVKLSYRASDDSSRTRERIAVYRGSKRLWTRTTPLAATSARAESVVWTIPGAVTGRLRFSVQAWDTAGNASAVGWATLVVK